jgi:uncharacterized protein
MFFPRYFLALVLALATCIGTASAQDTCPPPVGMPTQAQLQAAQKLAKDRGFLWRMTKDGRNSYLYGTIHIAKLDWVFPGLEMRKALSETDSLALELNLLEPDTLSQLTRGAMQTVPTPLPPALQERLARQAQANCVPIDQLTPLRPEFQIITLSVMALRKDGLEAAYGLDMVLTGMAQSGKKPIQALETPAGQLALLQVTDTSEALAAVEDGLLLLENGSAQVLMAKLAKAWEGSDHAALSSYTEWCKCANTPKDQAKMHRLLDERNPVMAQSIDSLHKQGGRIFAAVGALHMIGPQGLPALMAKLGYTVEKVF